MGVDSTKLTAIEAMAGEDDEETGQLRALHAKARAYLEGFRWCGGIRKEQFGLGVADIVGVFLFEITPAAGGVDSTLWAVVGDIPSAYLVVDDAPNPACALDAYVWELGRWADAAILGKPVDDLIPLDAPATKGNGKDLKTRLEFLKREILSCYAGDLADCASAGRQERR